VKEIIKTLLNVFFSNFFVTTLEQFAFFLENWNICEMETIDSVKHPDGVVRVEVFNQSEPCSITFINLPYYAFSAFWVTDAFLDNNGENDTIVLRIEVNGTEIEMFPGASEIKKLSYNTVIENKTDITVSLRPMGQAFNASLHYFGESINTSISLSLFSSPQNRLHKAFLLVAVAMPIPAKTGLNTYITAANSIGYLIGNSSLASSQAEDFVLVLTEFPPNSSVNFFSVNLLPNSPLSQLDAIHSNTSNRTAITVQPELETVVVRLEIGWWDRPSFVLMYQGENHSIICLFKVYMGRIVVRTALSGLHSSLLHARVCLNAYTTNTSWIEQYSSYSTY
jgi:hypothetical protein